MAQLAALAAECEQHHETPAGGGEGFAGYGVMGLPFTSGHVLALRRFPASSIGPPYTSVWHRDPDGRWAFWQNQPDDHACPRYYSAALAETRRCSIDLTWPADSTLEVSVPELAFSWSVTMAASPVTRVLNVIGSVLPERAWHARPLLRIMAGVAGPALRAGRVGLAGVAPNGQEFLANPIRLWIVADSTARLGDEDFGSPGPLREQVRLGDFWIPQRGVFAIGRTFFAPASSASPP